MAGNVVVEQASVSVVPGETATATIRVRNTGAVVDSYSLTVLGQAAAWTTVVPAALSLFPGADGNMELHFAPPRAANVGSGAVPFGVRVVGSEDPDNPMVEEGEVDLLPFVEVAAKLTPRTSETKRKSKHEIVVDNKGNASIGVHLSVSDPDEQLAFELSEPRVTVDAGQSRHVPVKVMARKGFMRGADKHRPFQAKVEPDGQAYPITLDGNLIQKAGLPRFVLPLVAGVIALALIAAVLPGLLNKDQKGNLQLTGDEKPTTTVPALGDAGGEDDPNAPATAAEQEAAAAAELAANGKDADAGAGGGGSGGGDSGGSSSGGGGTSAAGAATGSAAGGGSTSDGSTATTARAGGTISPSTTTASGGGGSTGGATSTTAAGGSSSGGSTTTSSSAPPTTAAPKSGVAAFTGSWTGSDGGTMTATNSLKTGGFTVNVNSPTMGAFSCTAADDPSDNTFAGNCSDGRAHQFSYISSTDRVNVTYPPPARQIEPCKCVIAFTRNG